MDSPWPPRSRDRPLVLTIPAGARDARRRLSDLSPHARPVHQDPRRSQLRGETASRRGGSARHRGRGGGPHRLVDQAVNSASRRGRPVASPGAVGMAAGEQAPADRHVPDRNLGLSPGAAVCSVELTEVDVLGQTWWTLGFEAGGRGALGRHQTHRGRSLCRAASHGFGVQGRGCPFLRRVDPRARRSGRDEMSKRKKQDEHQDRAHAQPSDGASSERPRPTAGRLG